MSEWPKEITYKDTPALEYESGVILNADTKKIMRPADKALFDVNGENSPIAANETKRELAVQAAMRGMAKGVNLDPSDFYGGVETLTEAQARLAMDTSAGHASTRAYAEVMKAVGLRDTGRDAVSLRSPDGYTIKAESQAAMRELVDMLRSARDGGTGGE